MLKNIFSFFITLGLGLSTLAGGGSHSTVAVPEPAAVAIADTNPAAVTVPITHTAASSAPTSQPPPAPTIAASSPVLTESSTGVSEAELNQKLNALENKLTSLVYSNVSGNTAAIPQNIAANGNPDNPYAAGQRINNLSNIAVNGISGLTASDIPSLSYLPLSGGSLTFASSTLFSVYNGAYFGSTATSSFDSTGALTLATPLAVSSGGTGLNNINTGSILFGNGSSALATSSNLYWDNLYSRLGVGTSTATSLWQSEPVALVFEGDSNTANTTVGWQTLMTRYFPLAATSSNWALSGDTCANMVGEYASQAGSIASNYGEKDFFLNCGTNDIAQDNSAATIYANLKSIWASARASGYKVIAFTVPPMGTNSVYYSLPREATRQALNTLIQSDPTLYDGLVNLGNVFSVAMMTSPSIWNAGDGIHYYTSAGSELVAQLAFQAAYAKVQTTGLAAQTIGTWALNTSILTVSSTTGMALIKGSLNVGNHMYVGTSTPASSISSFVAADSASGASFEIGNGVNSATASIYPASNFPVLDIFRNGDRTNIAMSLAITGTTPTFTTSNADIVFQRSGVERFRTDSNGGATVSNGPSASSFLTIAYASSTLPNNQQIGGINFSYGMPGSAPANRAAIIAQQTGGSSVFSATDLQFYTSIRNSSTLTQQMVIQSSGNIGLSTTTPWRTLSVTGTVGFDGLTGAFGAGSLCLTANKEVVYNSGSDACLSSLRATKHDITPLTVDYLSQVAALAPVSFIYNNDASSTVRYGFIAEDAAAVDPHLGTYDASGNLSGVDDRGLLAIIVGALQSLTKTVSDFALNIVSAHVTATVGDFDTVNAKNLCAVKSDGTQVCVSGDQLANILSGAGGSAPVVSGDSAPADATSSLPEVISTSDVGSSTEVTPPVPEE